MRARKIVLFNGPPGAGKDTIAVLVAAKLKSCRIMKFAAPLKRAAAALYCEGDRAAFDQLDRPERKNEHLPDFFGLSCREVQIAISEQLLKPLHGNSVFGEILAAEIDRDIDTEHFLVSDSGFRPEAEVLIKSFGAEALTLIRLHRAGRDFTGDSRGYIDLGDMNVRCVEIGNTDGAAGRAADEVLAAIGGCPYEGDVEDVSLMQAMAGQGE